MSLMTAPTLKIRKITDKCQEKSLPGDVLLGFFGSNNVVFFKFMCMKLMRWFYLDSRVSGGENGVFLCFGKSVDV
jgi:hypothetical protein